MYTNAEIALHQLSQVKTIVILNEHNERCHRTKNHPLVTLAREYTLNWLPREVRDWLKSNSPPHLILADIQLSDMSIDFLATVRQGVPVIFTTAFDEYAIRAFKVNSIDYLLKPVDKNELTSAFEKFEPHLGSFRDCLLHKNVMLYSKSVLLSPKAATLM